MTSSRRTPVRPALLPALVATAALALGACAGAPEEDGETSAAGAGFPVEIESCGVTSTVDAKVERGITMNQGATEVALALGLEEQLVGTAYLDDEVPAKWKKAYDSVTVLSDEYADHETVLAAKPDFVYGSYISAFEKDSAGTQDELEKLGIASYTSPFGCGENKPGVPVSFDSVWAEIDTVATVFGVPERAAEIEKQQKEQLARLKAEAAGADTDVFWFDSGDKTAFAGGGEGGPQLILDAIGATNVFADLEGGWADVSWEKVVATDPDVIVLADAVWSTAEDKIAFLEKDPALSRLEAVRDEQYVILPFSETTPGVRLPDGAQAVADGLAKLDRG